MLYLELESALSHYPLSFGAAECHGMISGFLCAAGALPPGEGISCLLHAEDFDGQETPEGLVPLMMQVYTFTVKQIDNDELDFKLLLPDDDSELSLRTDALGKWCQGFVYGLGIGGVKEPQQLEEDAAEVVKDFTEITKMHFSGDVASESDEQDYAELFEYVRMGVLILNDVLSELRPESVHLH